MGFFETRETPRSWDDTYDQSWRGALPPVGDDYYDDDDKWQEAVREGTEWGQPQGTNGPMPRKTAWMVKKGCTCVYRYGGAEVDPQEFPPWMLELLRQVMPLCGLPKEKDWPDSCNLNHYDDGGMSVGWHTDDERLFQGKFQDIRIISLSFGQTRKFELRMNWPEDGER